jgi:SAM-dependent methyltransferase
VNYDNSPSVKLARRPLVTRVLRALGLLKAEQVAFIDFCKHEDVRWADVTNRIPEPDASVQVVYSSHMLEHLTPEGGARFLREAMRVLRPGGVLRLAVPDLRYFVDNYLRDGDAAIFMSDLYVIPPQATSLRLKLLYLLVGDRRHKVMFDAPALCRLLAEHGYESPTAIESGTTMIEDPGLLDLSERAPESLFVEARKPGGAPASGALRAVPLKAVASG